MIHTKIDTTDMDKRSAYRLAGYAVACYDLKISVSALTIDKNKSSDYGKLFAENLIPIESEESTEKSRLLMEKIVVSVLSGIKSEKRFYKSTDSKNEKYVIKKIRQVIAPFTRTDREITAYHNLLDIRAQDFIDDPLIRQQIKDLSKEILNSRNLSAAQVRSIIRKSFSRSFEKWKNRQRKVNT